MRAYQESADLLTSIGSGSQFIAKANLAQVLQLRGAFAPSRRLVEELLRERSAYAYPREQMVFAAVLLPCLVDDEDYSAL